MNVRLRTVLLIIGSTLVLSWPLIWNGFPLVYWDSAYYLTRWSIGSPILVQPIYYSYWLMLFHPLPFGLTICALTQAAITSALLYSLIRKVLPSRTAIGFFIATLLIAISPTVFHITSLMPDVSTLWLAFACPLLVLSENRKVQIVTALIILAALSFHNSHVLILFGLLPIFTLVIFRSHWKMTAALLASIFIVYTGLYALNNTLAGLPPFSSASTFMLAARLNQSGSLHLAFNELAAGNADYSTWANQTESLIREPEAFLWDERSPLNLNYPEWSTNPAEHQKAKAFLLPVVSQGMNHHLSSFLHSGKHSITSMMTGEYLLLGFTYYDSNSMVTNALESKWPHELSRYNKSKQGQAKLLTSEFPFYVLAWKSIIYALSLLSILLFVGLLTLIVTLKWKHKQPPTSMSMSVFLLAAFWLNVLVCAMLSSIGTRYIERGFVLCLLPVVIAVASRFNRYGAEVACVQVTPVDVKSRYL